MQNATSFVYTANNQLAGSVLQAMWEIEVALVFGRIVEARAEISNRLLSESLTGPDAKERLAISEAMVCLRSWNAKTSGTSSRDGKVVLEKVSRYPRDLRRRHRSRILPF